MKIPKEMLEKTAKPTGIITKKWVFDILRVADRYGIDRNTFINSCTGSLAILIATTDFTNIEIPTCESEDTQ